MKEFRPSCGKILSPNKFEPTWCEVCCCGEEVVVEQPTTSSSKLERELLKMERFEFLLFDILTSVVLSRTTEVRYLEMRIVDDGDENLLASLLPR